ncbi:DUF1003 domain-containing protein [Paenibacillus sp. CGMCC 1.16610]|uniref:DUF1003 domain-containing protein n=1 Tax=Paenibacillus anseongense TaxID=2682845 RepID=A0ABW9U3D3_9BACL|nr:MULTISPECIES: DUF1003 domain-containing protein [Paenibacillus]MBA2938631.1 DUF1003 domain-containing protein [Paenibacillus sp. CGMCC 1.16610]MVQ34594.1 DUF1003 domain-containing protein [Paenibacillus anseongense]
MNKKNMENDDFFDEASVIQGFDIELSESNALRIDRLVDEYEKSILNRVDEEYSENTTISDRLADSIAKFGGSWTFIGCFGAVLVVWMIWNTLPFIKPLHFDEPPFILLNLCLSFLAAFQAPIIMMSQNRQSARDKHESVIDFAINYKAEQEIDDIQKHLHRMEEDDLNTLEQFNGELLEIKKLLASIESRLSRLDIKTEE